MATKSNDYFSRHATVIPLIQRDYVQGSDMRADKRNPFVKTILQALATRHTETINFIYGVTTRDGQFIPLDGQQRLTSLNLLGWLLLQHVKKAGLWDNTWDDRRKTLRISYESRDSSREFCRHLFESDINDLSSCVSQQVADNIWFAESWHLDPTITAMLQMFDYLAGELAGSEYCDKVVDMAERFFTDAPIEFDILDNLNIESPDDLYIKINARGKALTPFEHWKAWFIKLLEKNFGHRNDLVDYFEVQIEHDWTQVFWSTAIDEWDELDKKEKSVQYPRIDSCIMRVIEYITEMIIAGDEGLHDIFARLRGKADGFAALGDEAKRELYEAVYRNRQYVKLLFKLLDTMTPLSADGFFERYLFATNDPRDEAIAVESRVNLFNETGDNVDLLKALYKGNRSLSLRARLLLWGMMNRVAVRGDEGLPDFVRDWWMYLMSRRQRLKERYEVTADIGLSDVIKFTERLNAMLTENISPRAADEISLLNHPWLLDDLRNTTVAPGVYDSFVGNFVKLGRRDKIRALIGHGFNGVRTVDNGSYLTFGLCGNWPYILTDNHGDVEAALRGVLDKSPETESVKWPADFVRKYIDVLMEMPGDFAAFNVDYHAGTLFGTPKGRAHAKQGFRLEPYSYVTARLAGFVVNNGKAGVTYGTTGIRDELTLFTENSTHYGICFQHYGLQMEAVKSGWWLSVYDKERAAIPATLEQRWGELPRFVENYDGNDRVETGVALLHEIISLL